MAVQDETNVKQSNSQHPSGQCTNSFVLLRLGGCWTVSHINDVGKGGGGLLINNKKCNKKVVGAECVPPNINVVGQLILGIFSYVFPK